MGTRYVANIFLYNSESWTSTKAQEQVLETFQQRIIKTAFRDIRWPRKLNYQKSKWNKPNKIMETVKKSELHIQN